MRQERISLQNNFAEFVADNSPVFYKKKLSTYYLLLHSMVEIVP